ncbi:MAG: hypothetical protein EPN75_02645 [Beijerinckiaceae bacterium]|nr:MAG: hypothetical protein EPN75_02645 [Beijerinckiaceae bacterium]
MLEVVYSAFGRSFVQNAAISAASVKRHAPELITSLITGEFVSCPAFDNIGLVEPPQDASKQVRFARAQKTNAILNSKADRLLYLDADTYVTANLIDWFPVLDRADIALSYDTRRRASEAHRGSHAQGVACWQSYFDTGVMFVKRSKAVDRFLQRWAEAFAADEGMAHDQWAFQQLIHESGLRVYALPPEINVRASEPIHISGHIAILHRAPFRDDKPEWRSSSAFLGDFLNSRTGSRVFTPHDGRLAIERGDQVFSYRLQDHEARIEKEGYLYPPLDFASAESASGTKVKPLPVSLSRPRMTLYTSLPPSLNRTAKGRELGTTYQKACVDSWRAAGFDVVSLNTAAEIEALSAAGFDIGFHEVEHAPPHIGEMLDAAREGASDIAGIINADCMLLSPDGIIASMIEAAREGLVMVERMNLDPEDLSVTGESCQGFDLFLFGRERLNPSNFDDEIAMGTPWWDYWFPLSHQQVGKKLYLVAAPILLHLDHRLNWNHETYMLQRRRCHAALSANKSASVRFPFIDYDRTLTDDELAYLAPAAFAWLKETPQKLDVSDERSEFVSLFLSALNETSALHRSKIDLLSKELAAKVSQIEGIREPLPSRLSHSVRKLLRGSAALQLEQPADAD